jgi:hypothetical protein
LAVFVTIAWAAMLLLTGPVTAYVVGNLLLAGRTQNDLLIIVTGVAALLVLYNLPFLNILAFFVAAWTGSGAVLLLLWSRRGTLRRD